MKIWCLFLSAARNLLQKNKAEQQLDSELSAYVEMVTDEKVAAGASEREARRNALAEIGGMEQVKQAVRDGRTGTSLEMAWLDIRFGWRQLVRNQSFTGAVIATLALSIGMNTAIFSIVNALMLAELPFHEPERLGTVFMKIQGSASYDGLNDIDGEQWEILRDRVPSVQGAVASDLLSGVNLKAEHGAQYVHAGRISAGYFDVLGIRPAMGRFFSEDEDRPNGPKAAILSYDLWRNTFHSDANLVGQAILLKGEAYTVVGVLPSGAITPLNAEIYTDIQASRHGEGGGANYGLILRLRDGLSWQQADAEINRVWADRALRYASEYHHGAKVSFYTVPLQKGQTAELRPKALTLLSAGGIILLIACANLAGLTVVRTTRRTAEIATRMALGASRRHVQRQLWIENLLLAFVGGAFGIAVGYFALHGFLLLLPEGYLPVSGIQLDVRVLAFSALTSLLTCVLVGMLPALAVNSIDLRSFMTIRTIAGVERLRFRQLLIAGEVALTVVLLTACGLLMRTLIHLQRLSPGFNPTGIMTAKVSLDDVRYRDPVQFDRLMLESTAAMTRIPGVKTAAVGLTLPYERALNNGMIVKQGPRAGQQILSGLIYVTPNYFSVLQIPVLSGRSFTGSDQRASHHVAIVNRAFVREFFGGVNPVGQTLDKEGMTIVGVVEDVILPPHVDNVSDPLGSEPIVYIPTTQAEAKFLSVVHAWIQPSWIVRTDGPITGLTGQMQRALADVDPGLPFSGFYTMNDYLAKAIALQRVEAVLLGVMAGLALLLSAVGIFALVANIVTQRTREIGIRIALGATVKRVMTEIAASAIRSAALGLVSGLIACVGTLRVMRSVIYGVGIYDFPTVALAIGLLAAVTLLAAAIPTLRVTRTDPARTLREQ
jgi:Acidobacterial duplicated orphan permease